MALLLDSFRSLILFDLNPSIPLYEKSVTPAEISGGDPIDLFNMRITRFLPKGNRRTTDVGMIEGVFAYDPVLYSVTNVTSALNQLFQRNGGIQHWFPDLSMVRFYGFLNDIKPGELVGNSGTQPTVTLQIVVSSLNTAGLEAAPVYSPPGTVVAPAPVMLLIAPTF